MAVGVAADRGRVRNGVETSAATLRSRGAVLVRHGKGGKRREVGMDRWAWEQLDPWLAIRSALPVGALFCVLRGPTCGRLWSAAGV